MKKIIIALAVVVFILGNTAFAHGKEVEKRVRQVFEKEFAGAVDINWYTLEEFYRVDFTFNNTHLTAYYNHGGEMLTLVRNIPFSVLPVMLQFDLRKNYKDYWITEIYELSNRDGTEYRLTIENADVVVRLHSGGDNEWKFVGREVKR
jgi:hypothetical protein